MHLPGMIQLLDQITMTLKDDNTGNKLPVYINVHDNSLSRKWLTALNNLVRNNYHLEKNYCFVGFPDSPRDGKYICQQINASIQAINTSGLNYYIDDHFDFANVLSPELEIDQNRFNLLHRYFEDLQGVSGAMSTHYNQADKSTRWHIRQLNLLCHEFESWLLSYRKKLTAPMCVRPSQLMCWLNSPRFELDENDYELFGIDTIARPLGGVFVGVNKAVGKHHWEVFQDEGRDSRVDELTTSSMRSQVEAAGDFDIEWGNNTAGNPWMIEDLNEFRVWLLKNGFDPEDKSLTIGHPQVGQVDLIKSFKTENYSEIWKILESHMNVYSISTSDAQVIYKYNWSDQDYMKQQIEQL